jgi:hypothetical protein
MRSEPPRTAHNAALHAALKRLSWPSNGWLSLRRSSPRILRAIASLAAMDSIFVLYPSSMTGFALRLIHLNMVASPPRKPFIKNDLDSFNSVGLFLHGFHCQQIDLRILDPKFRTFVRFFVVTFLDLVISPAQINTDQGQDGARGQSPGPFGKLEKVIKDFIDHLTLGTGI